MADEPQASGELSQDDIDAIFSQRGTPGADGTPRTVSVAPEVTEAFPSAGLTVLAGLAAHAAEVFAAGVEGVAGEPVSLVEAAVSVADAPALEREYAALEHVGVEMLLRLSGVEAYPLVVLLSLADASALLGVEGLDAASDAARSPETLEAMGGAIRGLLDLVSLTLFVDELAGAEVTLAGMQAGQAGETLAGLEGGAEPAPALRLQLALARASGSVCSLTLVIPSTLLEAVAGRLGGAPLDGPASAPPEPTPLRPGSHAGVRSAEEGPGFGLADDPARIASPRTAGAFDAAAGDEVDVHPVRFPSLSDAPSVDTSPRSLDLIMDVSMRVTVELGRSTMTVEDVLALGPGSVVELNKLAGEAVDVLVNDQLIARGEVVVVDENFGVRVTEIVSPRRRARAMGE
ncbi:MAG: flagellar motor switch protein FliN [Dehalococcoidia bacterium]